MSSVELVHIERVRAALKSMFIADSLAMPVHWFYRTADIYKLFPDGISSFHDAPEFHPSSIMSLHSTQQGGRKNVTASTQKEIVGDVILKGKAKFWNKPNIHYHQGMIAGDNTLNAHCARVLLRTLLDDNGHYHSDSFLENYINFMTADPPRHNDTYAESYHRGFFNNLVKGKPENKCGAKTHDTASIGGLVTIAPIVLMERLMGTPLNEVHNLCEQHLYLTHPDDSLAKVCASYVDLLDQLLFRRDSESVEEIINNASIFSINLNIKNLNNRTLSDNQVIGTLYSSACYIEHSWPGTLYLAYRYHNNLKSALIANTNLGGDNVHRGSVLGIILGLVSASTEQAWFNQLIANQEISEEIEKLLDLVIKRLS